MSKSRPPRRSGLAMAFALTAAAASTVLLSHTSIYPSNLGSKLAAAVTMTGGPRLKSDRKSTTLNSSHVSESRMPSSA